MAARRSNNQHRRSPFSQRTLPLLVADYCQLKVTDDGIEGITVLVARLYPARALLATVVDAKGPDDNAVARIANFIRDSGYSKMVYRTDQEASIRSLFEEAFRKSQRQGSYTTHNLNSSHPRPRQSENLNPMERLRTRFSALRTLCALIKQPSSQDSGARYPLDIQL